MLESSASPNEVRLRIAQSPAYETITNGAWKVKAFPTRAALATTLLTGCRAKEIVSMVVGSESREGIVYGVHGHDLSVEEYEGEEYLIISVTVLKKHLMMASSRTVAIPRSPEYEPLSLVVEEAFTKAADGEVFPYYRQVLSTAASKTFEGLSYYIHPYLWFDPAKREEAKALGVKARGEERQGHPHDMAIHALRHIREQELEDTFHLEDRQIQTYFKWSNTYMGVPESMGRYRGARDWRMYAQKLLRKRNPGVA